MWDATVEHLAAYDVVRYEQRGYCADDTDDHAFLIDDLVADLIDVADAVGVARFHIAGVSLGGMVATRATAMHPTRVSTLTIINSAPVLNESLWAERAKRVRKHGMTDMPGIVMPRWFSPEFANRNPVVVERYMAMLTANDAVQYARACDLLSVADVTKDLPAVVAPTLILGGSDDQATPPQDQERYRAGIHGSHLRIFEGVAHMSPAIIPRQLAEAIAGHAR